FAKSTHVCFCVCLHVCCVHLQLWVCVSFCVFARVYVCALECVCVCACLYLLICVSVCLQLCVCTCVCLCVCLCVHSFEPLYVCRCSCVLLSVCVHVCLSLFSVSFYVFACVFVCTPVCTPLCFCVFAHALVGCCVLFVCICMFSCVCVCARMYLCALVSYMLLLHAHFLFVCVCVCANSQHAYFIKVLSHGCSYSAEIGQHFMHVLFLTCYLFTLKELKVFLLHLYQKITRYHNYIPVRFFCYRVRESRPEQLEVAGFTLTEESTVRQRIRPTSGSSTPRVCTRFLVSIILKCRHPIITF
uniref:Uncharacterized protein n=1 Tax=Oryzias latipes TaxID=8090 RepID=A0A3P9JMS3_ORYLA